MLATVSRHHYFHYVAQLLKGNLLSDYWCKSALLFGYVGPGKEWCDGDMIAGLRYATKSGTTLNLNTKSEKGGLTMLCSRKCEMQRVRNNSETGKGGLTVPRPRNCDMQQFRHHSPLKHQKSLTVQIHGQIDVNCQRSSMYDKRSWPNIYQTQLLIIRVSLPSCHPVDCLVHQIAASSS